MGTNPTRFTFNGKSRPCIKGGSRVRGEHRTTVPLVSIITVVFNARAELEPLLLNLIAHRAEDIEIIVIDGGSQDGTVDFLRSLGDSVDYWISEPDKGIYDAMNKGIAEARGDFVLHINAGDRLKQIPREKLQECLVTGCDVVCFGVNVANWGDYPPRIGFRLRIENSLNHQGMYYRRMSHPGYDLRYRVFSDFDCNQKMQKSKKSFALYHDIVAAQARVGVSRAGTAEHEIYQIVRENYGVPFAIVAVLWRKLEPTRTRIKLLLNSVLDTHS